MPWAGFVYFTKTFDVIPLYFSLFPYKLTDRQTDRQVGKK